MSYKFKTKSSIKKRFKLTKSGKLKRASAGKSHLLTHKSSSRKARLRGTTVVSESHTRLIKECLPYGR